MKRKWGRRGKKDKGKRNQRRGIREDKNEERLSAFLYNIEREVAASHSDRYTINSVH